MRIARERKELLLKVVYYGPPLAGKTTNLRRLQEMIPKPHRSDLVSLDTYGDRTLFFDLMQVSLGKVGGLTPRVSVYTVPGQPRYRRVRDMVLRGADGIVFVADSAPARIDENKAMWSEMHDQLARMHMADRPVVVQVNKQDLRGALSPQAMRYLLRPKSRSYPFIPAQASAGLGVRETFMQIVMQILAPEKVA